MSNDIQHRIEALELALEHERIARKASEAKLRRWATRVVVAAGIVVGAGVIGRVGDARAACTSLLPAPLVTFCANEPAKASVINANFKSVADNIINKIGSLGSTDATMSKAIVPVVVGVVPTGGTSPLVTVSSDLTVNGAATIGMSGKATTVNGTVKLFGTNSGISLGATNTASSDGFVMVSFQSTATCNPTVMTLTVGTAMRAQATSSLGCGGDQASYNTLFGFVRKGESFKVDQTGGTASYPGGINFVPFGS